MSRGMLALAGVTGLALGAWLVAVASGPGHEGTSTSSLDGVRTVLGQVHGTTCNAREAAGLFDYRDMARRALGRHWRDRTGAERSQLVDLVRQHVLAWYSRLCERHDFVQFGVPVGDGDRASLAGRAIRGGRDVTIVYRLRSPDTKRWLVYDVEVAGRSHARALYAEFDRLLLNEGYAELVARLTLDSETPRAAGTP
jgi:ABC-type transporter MlaC component